MLTLDFGGLTFADIRKDAFDLDQPAICISDRRAMALHPAIAAVARPQAKFGSRRAGIGVHHAIEDRIDFGPIIRIDVTVVRIRRFEQRQRVDAQLRNVWRDICQGQRRFAIQTI